MKEQPLAQKNNNGENGLENFFEENYKRLFAAGHAYFEVGYTMLAAAEVLFRNSCRNRKQYFQKIKSGVLIEVSENRKRTQEESLVFGFLPATLLLALSIENFIKEYYCRIDETLRARHSKMPKKLGSHNLVILFAECKIQLTEKEKLLLKYLHAHLVWRGRYMLPKESKEYVKYLTTDFSEIDVYKSFESNNKFSPEVRSILKKLGVHYRGI